MIYNQTRAIHDNLILKIDSLERLQQSKRELFPGDAKEKFVQRLRQHLDKCEPLLIDDMINLLSLASCEDDLDLLEQIICKIDLLDANTTAHHWGVAVSRLYFQMGQLDRALKNMRDTDRFKSFFQHISSYKILMTQLYRARRYEEVIELFDFFSAQCKHQKPAVPVYLSVFASLAKINTEASFQRAKTLWADINKDEAILSTRLAAFLAYMAYKQEDYAYSINFVEPRKFAAGYNDLIVNSLLKLNRPDEVLLRLRSTRRAVRNVQACLTNETYEQLKNLLADQLLDESIRQEMGTLVESFRADDLLTNATIEELIFKPCTLRSRTKFNDQNYQYRSENQTRMRSYNQDIPPRRPSYQDRGFSRYNQDREAGQTWQDRQLDPTRQIYRPRRQAPSDDEHLDEEDEEPTQGGRVATDRRGGFSRRRPDRDLERQKYW